jgi:lysyl-tRNA synthetase class 2
VIFNNQYIQERIKKAEKLREEGINPYPANITKGMPSAQFFEHYAYVKEQDAEENAGNQTQGDVVHDFFPLPGR